MKKIRTGEPGNKIANTDSSKVNLQGDNERSTRRTVVGSARNHTRWNSMRKFSKEKWKMTGGVDLI